MKRRRKQLITVSALLVLFVGVLAIWVGNPNSGHHPEVEPGYTPSPTTSEPSAALPTPSITPSPTGTGGKGVGVTLPPVSGVQVYGPGIHHVVVSVSSNSTLAGVGYAFRNGKNGKKAPGTSGKYFSLSVYVEGGAPLAIVAGQVAYYGSEATCTVTVDGVIRTRSTVKGAYHVVVCTG